MIEYEELMVKLLLAPDPAAALLAAQADEGLPAALRRALAHVSADGLRLSALLVAQLRFNRLLQGCPEAGRWFDEAPAEFTSAFRRYHREVLPSAFFPSAEGKLFREWMRGANLDLSHS